MDTGKRERRYDLDWLRIIAVLILLLFHTGMIFVSWVWHIKSADTSRVLETVMAWTHWWRMPLLLFISGAGTCYALGFRTPGKFLGERARRLLIPLVFGMLVVVPPQIYFEKIAHYRSYLEFYPTVFQGVPYPRGNTSWHHLWFILYLFLFSALALPVFLWLRGPGARRFCDRLAGILRKPFGFSLFLVPMLLSQLALGPFFPAEAHDLLRDWAYFALCFLFFFYGYLCCRDVRIWAALGERRRLHLAIATVALVPFYLAYFIPYKATFFGYDLLYRGPGIVMAWYWVLAILGYGQRYLNVDSPLRAPLNEAVYPFYILHQTVIIMIGYPILRWRSGVWGSFALISLLSLLACAALIVLLIRPFDPVRILFGMKPRARGGAEGALSVIRNIQSAKPDSFRQERNPLPGEFSGASGVSAAPRGGRSLPLG